MELKKELIKELSKEELIDEFLQFLGDKYGITDEDILSSIKKKVPEDTIPIDVFKNDKLSALETISKYLRENCELTFSKIGKLTNRDPRMIGRTYYNASKKLSSRLVSRGSKFHLGVEVIRNRKLSVLENIVSHLKDKLSLSYHEIAVLLNRDDSTIWTVYNRAKKKRKNVKK